jgi:UDP-N-acetylglucosamine:LPS N-acetylglucosamine transferase
MKQDNRPAVVYCLNPQYDIHNDYRLRFLKEQGIPVESIYDAFSHKLNMLHHAMRFLYMWLFAKGRKLDYDKQISRWGLLLSRQGRLDLLRHNLRKLGNKLFKLTRKIFYTKNWARNILEQNSARVLCFDHIIHNHYVVAVLQRAAKEMSIPTIALPHGVYLYTNESSKAKSTVKQRFSKFDHFDYVVVQNHLRKNVLVRSGIAEDKIVVLGSARFCDEWIEQNMKILPRIINANAKRTEKLKIVFLTSKPQCRVDMERMLNTFNILANLRDIELMLKPHTRMAENPYLFDNLPITDASDILTAELCEWADVVLVIGTSVMTEALMQGKPVLYLKYLHGNIMLFEECGACWTIHDEAELAHAIQSLRVKKMDMPYAEENVDKFLSEVVYGGRTKRDVLRDYVQFITECNPN